jgi:hypothetical protein
MATKRHTSIPHLFSSSDIFQQECHASHHSGQRNCEEEAAVNAYSYVQNSFEELG